jgi:hypothetical protein
VLLAGASSPVPETPLFKKAAPVMIVEAKFHPTVFRPLGAELH